jgi:Domain of unknown function (DUF4350)
LTAGPAASVRAWVGRVPVAIRVGVAVAVGLVALNLVARGVDRSVGGSNPSGAPGSSYATAPDGLGAYATLLSRYGHGVTRQRGDLVSATIDPQATLMILEPDVLTDNQGGVALQFVVNGGHLVIGGTDADRYLHELRDHPPAWVPSDRTSFAPTGATRFGGVTRVVTAGDGMWKRAETSTVVMGEAHHALATEEHLGKGDIIFLADISPLTNAYLDQADNAAFGIALAGSSSQPVVFAEGVHGYGESRGFAAIPSNWKLAFAGIALSVLLLAWARARRLGPPEQAERDLPPSRREYVDALAITLERTRARDEAVAPVRAALRERIAQRSGLGPDATTADYERAGRALGLSDDEVRSMLHAIDGDDDVITVGRALARAGRWDTGRNE